MGSSRRKPKMLVSNRFDATFAGTDEFCSRCVAFTSQILQSDLRRPKSGARDNIVFPATYGKSKLLLQSGSYTIPRSEKTILAMID
jgi:hypothetical protein